MNEALAPIIWPLEVGNALVVAERRGRITSAETVRFLDLLYYGQITMSRFGSPSERRKTNVLNRPDL